MKSYNLHTARANLTDLVNQVAYGRERIAISRRDKPLVVVVPLEDAELLEYLEDREDVRAAKKALKEKGPNLKWDDVKKELALKRKASTRSPGVIKKGRARS